MKIVRGLGFWNSDRRLRLPIALSTNRGSRGLPVPPVECRRQGLAVAKPFPLATGPSPFQSCVLFSGFVPCYPISRFFCPGLRGMPPIPSGSDAPVSGKAQALTTTRGIHLRCIRCRCPPTLLVIVSGDPRHRGMRNVK